MKCEVLVRRGRTSILCQERTHLGWSGEDTPRSYVRRGYTSILCQERTVNTPRSWSGEDTPQSYARRGQRTHLDPGKERIHLDPTCQERVHLNPALHGHGREQLDP